MLLDSLVPHNHYDMGEDREQYHEYEAISVIINHFNHISYLYIVPATRIQYSVTFHTRKCMVLRAFILGRYNFAAVK